MEALSLNALILIAMQLLPLRHTNGNYGWERLEYNAHVADGLFLTPKNNDMETKLSIEESSRLIELGVDAKLASKCEIVDTTDENDPNSFLDYEEYPIFDLADILSILPKEILADEQKSDNHIYVCPLSIKWDIKYKMWEVRYDYTEYFSDTELIDALNQLLIWCLTEKIKST